MLLVIQRVEHHTMNMKQELIKFKVVQQQLFLQALNQGILTLHNKEHQLQDNQQVLQHLEEMVNL